MRQPSSYCLCLFHFADTKGEASSCVDVATSGADNVYEKSVDISDEKIIPLTAIASHQANGIPTSEGSSQELDRC